MSKKKAAKAEPKTEAPDAPDAEVAQPAAGGLVVETVDAAGVPSEPAPADAKTIDEDPPTEPRRDDLVDAVPAEGGAVVETVDAAGVAVEPAPADAKTIDEDPPPVAASSVVSWGDKESARPVEDMRRALGRDSVPVDPVGDAPVVPEISAATAAAPEPAGPRPVGMDDVLRKVATDPRFMEPRGHASTAPEVHLTGDQANMQNRLFLALVDLGVELRSQGSVYGWILDQVRLAVVVGEGG